MTGDKDPDPEYVAARRVLLDALDALGTHRKAVVLVGAQAIYLQVGAAYRSRGCTSAARISLVRAVPPRAVTAWSTFGAALEYSCFTYM